MSLHKHKNNKWRNLSLNFYQEDQKFKEKHNKFTIIEINPWIELNQLEKNRTYRWKEILQSEWKE